MTIVFTCFTWAGGVYCACGTVLVLLWIIDKTATQILKNLDWWKPFFRFVWMSNQQKQAWRNDAERIQRQAERDDE